MKDRYFKNLFAFIFSISSACTFPVISVGAVELSLNRGIVARNSVSAEDVLDRVGYLVPGAKVRIPKRYWPEDIEQTEEAIMKWLEKSGDLRQFSLKSGIRSDFYIPVEVVDAGKSRGVSEGVEVYVPIRFLVRSQGISLSITENTHAVAVEDVPEKESNVQTRRLTAKDYFENVQEHVQLAEQMAKQNARNRRGPASGQYNFESTCPITFDEFKAELKEVARKHFIPSELLLSVMHLETVGRCFAYRKELNGTASVGLFQINTGTTPIPACSKAQLNEIKGLSNLEQLRNPKIQCLQNPLTNLEEAARILREKYALVNSRKQPALGRWYNIERQGRDDWRKALSAYNGGQGYVYQSYYDIMDFNERHKAGLDPDNWEHRRVFFFRQLLDASIDEVFFEESIQYRRSLESVLTNMAYVESIVGRESRPSEVRNTLIFRWINQLYFQS